MKQTIMRRAVSVMALAFVLASVTPLVAVAAPPAKALEKQEAAQTRLEEKKLAVCQKRETAMKQLGILNLKYFVLDQKNDAGKTHTQATVSFNEAERGIRRGPHGGWRWRPGSAGAAHGR